MSDQGPIIDDSGVADKPSTPEQPPVVVEKEPVKNKPIQDYDINSSTKLATGDRLDLPGDFNDKIESTLGNLPNISMTDSPDSRRWAESLNEGLSLNTFREVFVSTLRDELAEFKQKIEHNNIQLMAASPKFKSIENENLKGERAIIRVISHLGMGTLFQVPLWHSGIWITFKPPTESEIVELNRLLISDKIKFGRYSYGLAFSNTTVYTTDRLVEFALAHTYDISTKAEDININNIKDHISSQDIPSLLWGFICTMYPRGFRYSRACVNNPDKCNHVVDDTLNVTKLQWTNSAAISEWQKTHMSSRQAKIKDLASVNRYKEELVKSQKVKQVYNSASNNSVSFTFKTPSITAYIDAGHRWIGEIVETVEKAVGTDLNKAERDNIIIRHGQASAMCQYSHWVDSIEYDSNIVDDRETIEMMLAQLSADDELRSSFIDGVVKYINNSTISVIGIPTFDCPKCGTEQTSSVVLPKVTNVIPLDVIQVFFELITQRLSRLTDR